MRKIDGGSAAMRAERRREGTPPYRLWDPAVFSLPAVLILHFLRTLDVQKPNRKR
jgi:hypothetical protein